MITIVTAFDVNYVPCFAAALISIAESISPDSYYEIIVLADGIPHRQRDLLALQVRGFPNLAIRYIEMSNESANRKPLSGHFTNATFFRFKCTELLPAHDKVLYIDPDIIVLEDLGNLFDTDISEAYAGAVLDYTMQLQIATDFRISASFGGVTRQEYWNNQLKLSPRAQGAYFNAGVMIFNLAKMRQDGISRQFEDLYSSGRFDLLDQDIMNKVFDGRIVHLSPRWNVIAQPLNAMARLPSTLFQEFAEAYRNPAVLHYAGWYLKPWQYDTVDFAEYFWMFSRKSAFYESSYQAFMRKYLLASQHSKLEALQETVASLQQSQEAEREKLEQLRQNHFHERDKLEQLRQNFVDERDELKRIRQIHDNEHEELERVRQDYAETQQRLVALQSTLDSRLLSRTWRALRAIGPQLVRYWNSPRPD